MVHPVTCQVSFWTCQPFFQTVWLLSWWFCLTNHLVQQCASEGKKRVLPLCKMQFCEAKSAADFQQMTTTMAGSFEEKHNFLQKFFKYTGVKQGWFSPDLLPRCYISVFQEHRLVYEKIKFKILYFSKHSMVIKPWFDKSHGMMLKT